MPLIRSTKKEVANRLQYLINESKSASLQSCVEWPFSRNEWGYGVVQFNRRARLAHRVSYSVINEVDILDLDGYVVRHKCDNPACFNPLHLEIGTQADNVADMHARKRNGHGGALGSRNIFSKLTEEKVLLIRALLASGERIVDISKTFAVTRHSIYRIKKGTAWSHI